MELKYLKEKFQKSKAKEFIEEHKEGIKYGLLLLPLTVIGVSTIKTYKKCNETCKKHDNLLYFLNGYSEGLNTNKNRYYR